MRLVRAVNLLLAAGLICGGARTASAQEAIGAIPQSMRVQSHAAPIIPRAASGLKAFYRKYGKYQVSVAAAGSGKKNHNIVVKKPNARAVVDKAFLIATSSFTKTLTNRDIRLDDNKVSWMAAETNDVPPNFQNFFHNVLGDVTAIVKEKLNDSPAGNVSFKITERTNTDSIDGEVLAVVFRVPNMDEKQTVVLLFGAQQPAGDTFELTLNDPINPRTKGSRADLGVAISFSCQPASKCGTANPAQYTEINVNGKRVSSSAGGYDDGVLVNGALITVGGEKDSRANPTNPNAHATNIRTDDELYNLLPFIKKTDRSIRVDTRNPSADDNMFFAYFVLSAEADVNADSDGDGLLDSWEKNGYDHNGDGVIDVNLPALGADYRHKDIFIAYAWMVAGPGESQSHQPPADVLNAVRQAFANAPVSNPDGTTGINMHFINRGSVAHQDNVDADFVDFDRIMNPKFSAAERKIFHRLLNGHKYGGNTSSGISRGIPGSDFMETLGGFSSNPGTFMQRAGTIMHELGHNLGLRHGGIDHENYKPNHLSIMSYLNQFDWLIKNGSPLLDYDRFDLADLNEANLNEATGLDNVGNDGALANYGVRWVNNGQLWQKTTGANQNVDWNTNSTLNTSTSVDLNGSGTISVLRGRFVEWDNIIYDGGDIGVASKAEKRQLVTHPSDLIELNAEDYEWMQRNKREVR